ncbi:ExbD/TolR family protein [Aquimonas voraii]|uniref:Biopolymer transport protein ExbD n=1 Tax=Aquimonas voraii TaxID=265719 RepID=A0A1G6WLP1_9GAMM|nr:biopolymer transporter ExbD [Aquimonas voraii]SDD65965.1 biopolymer transport protein ExbD [Aquimonas voraii]
MAFSSGNDQQGGPMAEINVTPLVDVMLVLLIIFMITAPLMSHKIQVKLPENRLEVPELAAVPGQPITIAIKDTGEMYWNDQPIQRSLLESQLAVEAQKKPQPRVEIRADRTTRYRVVSDVVKIAKDVGMAKVGFVITPER